MQRISVIICSLNPRPGYLQQVLAGLAAQTLPKDQWELLLVDNASDHALADTCDLSWHPTHRHVREQEPGLTPARLRGIKEATGEMLVFVDDDNVLASDYLERTLEIERQFPYLGVFGAGVLEPEFETEPQAAVQPLLRLLGLRTVPRALWSNNPQDSHCIPWGAGLCVPRATATAYVQLAARLQIGHILDRRGTHLFAGGDDLFSWVATREGRGFGIFPALRITHLVRPSRVGERYLLRLVRDHAYSHAVLRYVLGGVHHSQLQVVDVIRILLHGLRRGRLSMRMHWAARRGTGQAARDIATHSIFQTQRGESRSAGVTAPESS